MADLGFNEIDLYASKTEDCPWTAELYDSGGTTRAALALADTVHCTLSEMADREPRAAVLSLRSDQATVNDSTVVVSDRGSAAEPRDAAGYVRFAQGDLAAIVAAWPSSVASRRYVCEIWFQDASETDPASAAKLFLRGTVHLHRSAATS